jgi:hypothetical protein
LGITLLLFLKSKVVKDFKVVNDILLKMFII